MGGFSSKPMKNLHWLDSTEELSVWETVLSPGNQHSSLSKQQHILPITISNDRYLNLKFFLQDFEKWFATQGISRVKHGIRGLSLCLSLENDPDCSVLLSIKGSISVNNEEKVPCFERDLFINNAGDGNAPKSSEIMLQEHFLEQAILKMTDGQIKEKLLNTTSDGKILLKLNLAVKVMYSSTPTHYMQGQEPGNEHKLLNSNVKNEGSVLLARDLKKIYAASDNMLFDVVLKSRDGMTFNAHKIILAARSAYFRRWIQWNPDSFQKKTPVAIDNINGNILVAVLHWMYTGELFQDVGNILEEMIQASKLLEMEDLLKILEKRRHSAHENCSNCSGHGGFKISGMGNRNLDSVRKIKRAVLSWFPLLRYRFGSRPVGLVASIINAIYGIYELF